MERIVLHVDMDAFYASVEIRDRPELADVPVVIGADPRGGKGRGVASTCNYPARRYGIHSAMPISQAYRACPHAVFLRPDFSKYKPASESVMDILREYADILQVVGMDEAYLDITEAVQGDWSRVGSYCRSLVAAVMRRTGLSCSVGAAATKSVAKIASDHDKPHGVTVVAPERMAAFLEPLPVGLINGCGPKTAERLQADGLATIGSVAAQDRDALQVRLGKHGAWLWDIANGRDDRPVHDGRGPGKSRGNERTFFQDVANHDEVQAKAADLAKGLLRSRDRRAFATITVKIRYRGFETLTRARTVPVPIDPAEAGAQQQLQAIVGELLAPLLDARPVRLVGVRLSSFSEATGQRSLSRFGVQRPQRRTADPKCTEKSSHQRMTLLMSLGEIVSGNGTLKSPRSVI